MTSQQWKKTARTLKEAYHELEQEAFRDGVDIFSDEYKQAQDIVRERILEKLGFSLEEYREMKEQLAPAKKQDTKKLIEDTQTQVKELADRPIPEKIIEKTTIVEKPTITQQIINKIVKEKPTVIRETKTIDNSIVYDDTEIKKELARLDSNLAKMVIPPPIDTDKLKDDLKTDLNKDLSFKLQENINILGMPDFRKLAMGLQGQIDGKLNLDQTTPQTVINGIPISNLGWKINDAGKLYFGTGDDLQLYHDGGTSYITNSTGDLIIQNNSTVSSIGKIRLISSATNNGITGDLSAFYSNSTLNVGTSTSNTNYYTNNEIISLNTGSVFKSTFNEYVGKNIEINITGYAGALGLSVYGTKYTSNFTGNFAGNFVTLVAPFQNNVTFNDFTVGGSGYVSALENKVEITGTNTFTDLHGLTNVISLGGTGTLPSINGSYNSISANTLISSGSGGDDGNYIAYGYGTGSDPITKGNFCNYFAYQTNYTSDKAGIGYYANVNGSNFGDYAFWGNRGDSILHELYIGKPYNEGGATGGDLKANQVTNGDFSGGATGWTLGTGWTIASGVATKSAGTASDLERSVGVVGGRMYYFQVQVTAYTAGTLSVELGGVTASVKNLEPNLFFGFIQTTGTGNLKIKANSTAAYTIDNIIIREIGETNIYMGTSHLNFWDTGTYLSSVTDGDLTVTTPTGKTLDLATPVYDDLQFVTSTGKVPAANYPSWEAFTTNTEMYAFIVNDKIQLEANEPPHGWKEGTVGNAHIHLAIKNAQNSGSNQYAKFELIFAYADYNGVWTEQAAITQEVTIPTGSAALQNFLLPFTNTVTLTGLHIGTQITVRVRRIAATGGTEYGTGLADAKIFITQVGVHLEQDTIGSRSLTSK